MPLPGRSQLLHEAMPARNPSSSGAGIGNAPLGHWAGERKKSASRIAMPLGLSSAEDVREKTNPRGIATPSDILSPAEIRLRAQRRQERSLPAHEPVGLSSSGGEGSQPKGAGESGKSLRIPKVTVDWRFPTSLHDRVHEAPAEEAHKHLDQFWEKRNTINPNTGTPGLHSTVPGQYHKDEAVRTRAREIQAQVDANKLGGKTNRKTPEPPVVTAVVQHKKTGNFEIRSKLRTPKSRLGRFLATTKLGRNLMMKRHVGKDYNVVHTAISESLGRRNLLAEGLPVPRRDPPVAGDAELRSRIAKLTSEGAIQAAAALTAQLRAREHMRSATANLRGLGEPEERRMTPALAHAPDPVETQTPQQRSYRRTDQSKEKGAETNLMWSPRPAGHQTQKLTAAPGAKTEALPIAPIPPLDARKARQKTRRLPRVEGLLVRSLLLQELVANITGNTFLSKTAPGTRISGTPNKGNDTGAVGAVSAQGGVVPDAAKRRLGSKIKLSDKPDPIPSGRDGITRQFARQPSHTGGVLTLVRTQPKLFGG